MKSIGQYVTILIGPAITNMYTRNCKHNVKQHKFYKQSMKFCHIYKSNYLGKDNKVFLKEKKEEKSDL